MAAEVVGRAVPCVRFYMWLTLIAAAELALLMEGGGLGVVPALPAFFPGTSLESICFDLSSEVLLSTFDISLLFGGPCQTSVQGITQGSSLSHEEQRDSVVHGSSQTAGSGSV